MSKLKAAARNALPGSAFGLPKQRKFPIEDKAHAQNALGRATQQVNKGALSPAAASRIRAKADRLLKGC